MSLFTACPVAIRRLGSGHRQIEAISMRCLNPQSKLFTAKVTLLLPLLLLACSLRSSAQEAPGGQQTPAGDTQKDSNPPEDISRKPGYLFAYEGGSGLFSSPSSGPTAYAGFKIGIDGYTLDLGYDRIPSHHGFSTEVSRMFSVFRSPGPQKDQTKNYLRVFAEPGLGYRAGGGVGAYGSAKVMMVLFSDRRLTASGTHWSPFIEVQRRFPFGSPLRGDNRVAFGLMFAICEHCGLN
jgi:hypothetical protein